jgi:hypothetical protein
MPLEFLGLRIHAGVDGFTLGVGIAIVASKVVLRWIKGHRPVASQRSCGVDFLNGTAVVPFVLMIGSVISPTLFEFLQQTNMVFMGIAGGIGLLFVLGELADLPA